MTANPFPEARRRIALLGVCFLLTMILCERSRVALQEARAFVPPPFEVLASSLEQSADGLHLPGRAETFTGLMIERYPTGSLKSRSQIVNGQLNGLSDGWHRNGVLQVREHFEHGVSHGPRLKWHENGRKLSEAMIVNGRITGTFRRWHDSGALAEESQFKNGQPDGVARSFRPDGQLAAWVRMKAGKALESKFWNEARPAVAATSQYQLP